MVRLKEKLMSLISNNMKIFQFLMVRLKAGNGGAGDMDTQYFNSLWFD